MIFEYRVISKFEIIEEELNELGKDGWELCAVAGASRNEVWVYYFKRMIKGRIK